MWSRAIALTLVAVLPWFAGCLADEEDNEEMPSRFQPRSYDGKREKPVKHVRRKKPKDKSDVDDAVGETTAAVPEARVEPVRDQGPKTVVLIVADTVRADHTGLCGYERATTPFLTKFVENSATVHTCGAYSPGTWTLPSHATFFTGAVPTDHHVLSKGRPLDDELETLAEHFAGLGYQTGLVSGNPTLNKASGLWRGFERQKVANGLYSAWRGGDLVDKVDDLLAKFDANRPLFLVVNVFDAHDPYPAVPKGIDWAEPQPELDLNPTRNPDDGPMHALLRGELKGDDRTAWLGTVRNGYDYGIAEADRTMAGVMESLREGGFLDKGTRMVITSDHGEHLGEHDLVRHDGPPWEGVVRIPIIFRDNTAETLPEFGALVPGLAVYHLVKTGTIPKGLGAPTSASIAHDSAWRGRRDSIALWSAPSTKLMWMDGRGSFLIDLDQDPREREPKPLSGHPMETKLKQQVGTLRASKKVALELGQDRKLVESLRAVGYVD